MSDRQEMIKIYGAISEALFQCEDAAHRAGEVGEFAVQEYCLNALRLLEKAEGLF